MIAYPSLAPVIDAVHASAREHRRTIGSQARTAIIGVVDIAPYCSWGDHDLLQAARAQGLKMVANGADCLDISAEFTIAEHEVLSPDEEYQRTIPLLRMLRSRTSAVLCVSTTRVPLLKAAIDVGADMLNMISGFDVRLLELAAAHH